MAKTRLDREEIIKTLLASLMLLAIFGLAFYYALMIPQQSNQAVKLIMVKPSEVPQGVEAEIIIKAITVQGAVDTNRFDLVNISISNRSNAKLGFPDQFGAIWSSSLMIRLENGQVKIMFLDKQTERVKISVEWIDGPSPLEPYVIEVYSGYRVS